MTSAYTRSAPRMFAMKGGEPAVVRMEFAAGCGLNP